MKTANMMFFADRAPTPPTGAGAGQGE